jgi:DeoR/GlpR family transcriptional regulator of sugar metabolism
MASESSVEERSADERRMSILETAIHTRGKVRTRDLAERFGVGQNLLAYDIKYLERLGFISRGRGWIARKQFDISDLFSDTEFAARCKDHIKDKKALAKYLTSVIADGVQVLIDSGSTAMEIGYTITDKGKNLEIFSNNLPLMIHLATHTSLPCHIVGGEYDRERASAAGMDAANMIEGQKFDVAILTPRALSLADPNHLTTSSFAVQRKLEEFSTNVGKTADEISKQSLNFALYSMTPSQDAFKGTLMKNATLLYVVLDHHKISTNGRRFFTILVTELLREGTVRPTGASLIAPVRTRGPVLVRKMTENVDAPLELRDPESIRIVTTTQENGTPPVELIRLLRLQKGTRHFAELIEMIREILVVVDSSGASISNEWIDEYVL